MAKRCPYCGSRNTVEDKGNDALVCNKCERVSKLSAGSGLGGGLGDFLGGSGAEPSDILALVLTAVALVMIFLGFSQTKSLITYVLSTVVPDFETGFIDMLLIALSMLALLVFVSVARSGTIPAIILLTFMALYLIFFPVVSSFVQSESVTKYLNAIGCTIQYRDNPQALSICQQTTAGGPTVAKIGSKVVLKASFDQYAGSVIYGDEDSLNYDSFLLSVIVENPSETDTIKNFRVSDGSTGESYLTRSGNIQSSKKITLAYLKLLGDDCASSCIIGPMEKKTLSFTAVPISYCDFADSRACESAMDKGCVWETSESECVQIDELTRQMDAKVAFSYDYEVQGSFDFVLADSSTAASTALASRKAPTSSAGPVDVVVYFAPTYYVTAAGSNSEMRLTVTLNNLNAGKSADVYTPVHVARLNDGALERSGTTCSTPWGMSDFTKDQTEDRTDNIHVGLDAHLSKSQTYICTYSITEPQEWAGMQGMSKSIPFIVDVKYTYNDYISLSESGQPITVERI
ncbi:MAG: TFIIB-type zinc ribbon-containing protein [Candidatus Aenigmatarchaeota archaeon]